MLKNKDLRDFLNQVKKLGPDYYLEAKRSLAPDLQVCILQQKLATQGRFPVIFCPEIKGSKIPLVTNLFGSYELLATALGIAVTSGTIESEEPNFFAFSDRGPQKIDRVKLLNEIRQRLANKIPPQIIPSSEAPVKEVILKGKDIDLDKLPITRHGDLDSTKYVTIGCSICKDPETGVPNVGIYRQEVKGKDKILHCDMKTSGISYGWKTDILV